VSLAGRPPSPDLTGSIRKAHDFLALGAATLLQQAGVLARGLPDTYYLQLSQEYAALRPPRHRLQSVGFGSFIPHGVYLCHGRCVVFGFADDASFVRHLIPHLGVEVVHWPSFFLM
jgi:aminotransferase